MDLGPCLVIFVERHWTQNLDMLRNPLNLRPQFFHIERNPGNPGHQNLDIARNPGNPAHQNLDITRNSGNPRTQNFETYVAKPWKPKTRQSHHLTLPRVRNNHGERRFVYRVAEKYILLAITNRYSSLAAPSFKAKTRNLLLTQ